MGKRCLDCGAILRGRTDKKFCSDQCRNNYNNRLNRDTNNYIRNIHQLLRKNRKILFELYRDGKLKVHEDALIVLGYNFNFFTHIVKTNDNKTYCYCFDYGYLKLEEGFLRLIYNDSLYEEK